MKINILTPTVYKTKFSGGLYCIFKYAQGLHERGHEVAVIAYPGSERPEWIGYEGRFIVPEKPRLKFSSSKKLKLSVAKRIEFQTLSKRSAPVCRALILDAVGEVIPDADITLATFWETAHIAHYHGKGRKAYFMQHFESVFYEMDEPDYFNALSSYSLPLCNIANSKWLFDKVSRHVEANGLNNPVRQCTNAVELDHFRPRTSPRVSDARSVNVISYGGRGVAWKGFREMAEAVALVRQQLPDYRVNWNVYGDAALPADNTIAPYNHLGFLGQAELAEQYRENDILLSASWYESFPLFPIEGMASGLAVITTAPGTEDYARDLDNALIVDVKNPASVAEALSRLVVNVELRESLSKRALETAKQFSWNRSIENMEKTFLELIA